MVILNSHMTLPQEIIDEIDVLDARYKIIEDGEGGKEGEIHFKRREEIRRLRLELYEPVNRSLLNPKKVLCLEEIRRKLRHQTILLEKMEEETGNNI